MAGFHRTSDKVSRRAFASTGVVAGAIALGVGRSFAAAASTTTTAPNPDCPKCGGVGRMPIKDAKPLVWIKPAAPPKWESVQGQVPCSLCQEDVTPAQLAKEMQTAFDAALAKNKAWEERTGWKLGCMITRHVVVHTQLPVAQARAVGMALEQITLHLKKITQSLVLTPTQPDTLELVLLWEKASWDQFRTAMERLYTPEELGEAWQPAREYNAYDHYATPHMYETPVTVRTRPPSCGATFLVTRRQIRAATSQHVPFWLMEGFGAYGDYVVHKANRWFTVYSSKQVPVGDWIADARKLVGETRQRPWAEMINRELRDWESDDHVQTMTMTAYLLEAEPAKFLNLVRRLRDGADQSAALEAAYGAPLDELERRWIRWLLAKR